MRKDNTTLDKVWELVQGMNLQEQEKLRQRLNNALDFETKQAEQAFHQALLDSGLVKEIKISTNANKKHRKLVEIQGKPLSATIIEERR